MYVHVHVHECMCSMHVHVFVCAHAHTCVYMCEGVYDGGKRGGNITHSISSVDIKHEENGTRDAL